MNPKFQRAAPLILFIIMIAALLSIAVSANSAEPPSVTVIVSNPPSDFACALLADGEPVNASVTRAAWEGQYSFHSGQLNSETTYSLSVTANGETFVCEFPSQLVGYSDVFTLDLDRRTLTEGFYPLRNVLLISIRLVSTLLIEGLIFFAFGYRQKKSWAVFLIVNLITQGLLNIWLNSMGYLSSSVYLIIALIFGEFLVFAAEMIAMPLAINERRKLRTLVYAFLANLVSLFAGGLLLTVLPV